MKYFLYIPCLLWDIPVWVFLSFLRMVRIADGLRWEKPPKHGLPGLWATLRTEGWFYQQLKDLSPAVALAGVTLGHGGIYRSDALRPGVWTSLQRHENRHVEQWEVVALFGWLLVAPLITWGSVPIWTLLPLWAAWPIFVGVATFVAWLRGEDPYTGAIHETDAYSYHPGD